MYIWRGKNRRDKRNLLLGGERFWGAEKGAKNFEHEDNVLRLEKENEHAQYYGKKIKALMIQYLSTEKGMNEVELLLKELEKTEHFATRLSLKDNNENNETIKANVFDLYQTFCLPETTYIDKGGLAELFRELQMTMSKTHFEKYLTKLNLKQKGSRVDFDGFYRVLMEDLNESSKSHSSSFFFRKKTETESETEKNSSLAYKMQHCLKQNEAKLILIEHAVYHIEIEARQEYRIVHPSQYICEQCNEAFINSSLLHIHIKDIAYHRECIRKKLLLDERFQCVELIFQGNQGRHLRAHRLIHSKELGSLRARIDVAVEDPYRPNIADLHGKRYAQQMNGSMVTGYDAKAGIRPNHKRYGLIKQHQAPLRQKTNVNSIFQTVNHPQLQEVLHHLQRCKDNFIDTVSTCDHPMNTHLNAQPQQQQGGIYSIENEPLTDRDIPINPANPRSGQGSGNAVEVGNNEEEVFASTNNDHGMCAIVRFQWNSFANNQVYIIGEFTGWRKEEMVCSIRTNKFTIYKQLSPGRYRYRFVIDGIECVDAVASQVPDAHGPDGLTNEILVTNTPLYHTHLQQQEHSISRTGVASPMQAATQQHALDKLGLVPSASGKFSTSMKGTSTRLTSTSPSKQGGVLSLPILSSSKMNENTEALTTTTTMKPAVEQEEEESEFDNRSVGAIVHISQTDKEGLIRHLKHIELRNVALYDDGVWALASYINRNSFIQMIDLSYNSISDDGIQGFCGCLPLLDALHTLKLNGNGFGVDACRYLTANLESSTTLTALELANNRIGDDGTEVLSQFLRHNEFLTTLYLDTCLVGDDGIECLQEALLYNRRLTKLSLMCNRFTVKSMMKLGRALQFNASLETLVLSHNPIGPEAVNCIGSSLLVNDTLKTLELADVDLLAQHSSFGLHGVCAGVKTNKSLTKLDLRSNKLTDHHVVDLAHVLMVNTTLTDLDLSGNTITKIWFTDYTYIPTHILPQMPSIETLRHRNRITARGHKHTYDASKSRYLDDIQKGKWTFRRQWKREVQSQHEKATIESEYDHEQMRIDTEIEYIRVQLTDIMITVREYLEQEACRDYITAVSKAIKQYFYALPNFDSKRYNRYNMSVTDISVIKGKNNLRSASIKLKRSNTMTNIPTTPITTTTNTMRSSSPLQLLSLFRAPFPTTTTTTPPTTTTSSSFNMEHFLNAHISITHAVFSQLNNHSPTALTLSPLLLQQAFHLLTIPLPDNQVQDAVDATIIHPLHAIGIHKFSDYILQNIQYICKINKIQRIRILSDLLLNSPIIEAKTIIYNHLYHVFYNELIEKYRNQPENIPKYVCYECKKRFTKEKYLNKHMLKGNNSKEHRLYKLKEVIQHSQILFLQDIKHTLTNVFFPAYYELKPSYLLPKHYYPQVFDKIGKEGRPIGVVEACRTVRALDAFGEFLHVNLHGQLGWIRYRSGREHYLQPVGSTSSTSGGNKGFDWDKLHIQETITYYRVNDALSPEVELKVRYQPLAEGEVLGYLRRNQVIECYAVIGDWLQVRYGTEDAAWVRWRTTPSTDGSSNTINSTIGASGSRSFPARMISSIGFDPTQSLRSLSMHSLASFSTTTKLEEGPASPIGSPIRENSKIGSPIGSPTIGSPTIGSPIARYRGTHTNAPGTAHTQEDNLYKDDTLTYEINGIKTKAKLRKNPHLSREKILHFNRVRYGSTSDGSDTHNLLLLPAYFVAYLIPPRISGQIAKQPDSPLELNQNQIFDYIMSKPIEELVFSTENTSIQSQRNEMFFDPLVCSPVNSPIRGGAGAQRRRNRRQRSSVTGIAATCSIDEDGAFHSPSKLSTGAEDYTYFSDEERGSERGGGRGREVVSPLGGRGRGRNDGENIKLNRFGVSFKDQVYTVEDEEDLVFIDHALIRTTEINNLQNYDFIKTKKH